MRFYRPVGPVKAMTFDLDDTLYDNGPVIRAAEATLKNHISEHHPRTAALSPGQWHHIKQTLLDAEPRLSSDMGRWRMQTLQQALTHDIDDETEVKKAAKVCFDCFYTARSNFVLTDEMHQTDATNRTDQTNQSSLRSHLSPDPLFTILSTDAIDQQSSHCDKRLYQNVGGN